MLENWQQNYSLLIFRVVASSWYTNLPSTIHPLPCSFSFSITDLLKESSGYNWCYSIGEKMDPRQGWSHSMANGYSRLSNNQCHQGNTNAGNIINTNIHNNLQYQSQVNRIHSQDYNNAYHHRNLSGRMHQSSFNKINGREPQHTNYMQNVGAQCQGQFSTPTQLNHNQYKKNKPVRKYRKRMRGKKHGDRAKRWKKFLFRK